MKKSGISMIKEYRTSFFLPLILIISLVSLITGCEEQPIQKPGKPPPSQSSVSPSIPAEPASPPESEIDKKPVKLQINDAQFQRFVGWLDNRSLLYLSQHGDQSQLFLYDLFKGTSTLLYSDAAPIVDILPSPDNKMIMVHTAPFTYQAKLVFLDLQGDHLYSVDIDSFELAYDWNNWDSEKLAVTAFDEEWNFQVYIVDWKQKKLQPIESGQPLLKWFGKDILLAQDWQKDEQSLDAPIIKYSLQTIPQATLEKDNVFQFNVLGRSLMTISEIKKNEALYEFTDAEKNVLFSFSVPSITQYSDWLVPYYDFNEETEDFLSFVPHESGAIDEYAGGYKLVDYNLQKKSSDVLFDQLDNEPLKCSPDGAMCLYGYQLEKLINVNTKEITELLEPERK
ncbi:hypothetical protein [Falsibacillus pallidus]|uniref:YqgU-like beta propeller domain-containing protein n=1 Tax=Falsibacillus pallidus TaxID=493781 RepID=UPI003D9722DB